MKDFFSGFAFDQRLSLLLGQFHYSLIILVGFAADVLLSQCHHILLLVLLQMCC